MYKAWDYRCADIKLVWGPPGMQLFYVSHSPGISLLLCVNSLTGARIITGVLNFCAGSSGPHLSLQVSWLQRPSLWPASLAPLHLRASLQTWLCYASLQTLPSPVSCCHSRRPAQHGCSALIFLSASVTGLGCQGTATVALTAMLNQPHLILV